MIFFSLQAMGMRDVLVSLVVYRFDLAGCLCKIRES